MSVTLPPQGSHFEDGVRSGPYFGSVYTVSTNVLSPPVQTATPADSTPPGIYMTPSSLLDIQPTPVSTTLIAAAQTLAAAGYFALATVSVNGLTVLTSYAGLTTGRNAGPLLQLDSPRNFSLTSAGNAFGTNAVITFYGWDQYGIPIAEQINAPNTTTVYTKKAFMVLQGIYSNQTTNGQNVSIGVGNTFGLPFFLKNANYISVPMWNNTADLGLVAGVTSAALANNPITTVNGSSVVTVTVTSTAGLTNGQFVTIAGATTGNGITAAQFNITAPIAVVDATHFTYVTMGLATGAGATGGAAVTYTPNTIGVGGTVVVADETSPTTASTGDVRGTYTPTSNADGIKRLTINMYSASGDTRKFNGAISASAILPFNPITTTMASAVVSVNAPNHDFTTGESVTITGVSAAGVVDTITINGTWAVTVVDQNTFTFTAASTGAGGATGGGAAVTITPGKGNLYQTVTSRFGYPQYTPATFP